MASFSYYGSVLSSSELLEKNLLCVTDADRDHQVKHVHADGLCYCIPFGPSDYQTLLVSCLGEVARKSLDQVLDQALDQILDQVLDQVLGELSLLFLLVVPLNICLLNVVGRRLSLTVLQMGAAILFMMVNICTTM